MSIETQLEKLGLSENEAKTYVASLKFGPATVQTLAAKASVSRPTTYLMIEGLQAKGLMSSYIKAKKKYFVSAQPNHLELLVSNLKKEALMKEAAATKIIAALSSKDAAHRTGTSIRILEGHENTGALQRDILDSGAKEVLELLNLDEARLWFPQIFEGDVREKIILKYKTKTIYTSSLGKISQDDLPKGHRHEDRYLDSEKYKLHGEVLVYGNRVVMTSFVPKKISTIIYDQGIAESARTLFMCLWEIAEKD